MTRTSIVHGVAALACGSLCILLVPACSRLTAARVETAPVHPGSASATASSVSTTGETAAAMGASAVPEEAGQEPAVRITLSVSQRKDGNLPVIESPHGSKDTPVMVPWAPLTNRYVTFEVQVEQAGNYRFFVTYADMSRRMVDISVNGLVVVSNHVFESTGGYDLPYQRKRPVCGVDMANGLNSVTISGQDQSLPIMSSVTFEK